MMKEGEQILVILRFKLHGILSWRSRHSYGDVVLVQMLHKSFRALNDAC